MWTARLLEALDDPSAWFEHAGRRLSFAEIGSRARAVAAGLAQAGARPGDRVASIAGSSLELVAVNLGCYYLGAIYVPINTRYRGAEVAHILADSGATIVFVDAAGAEVLSGCGLEVAHVYPVDAPPIGPRSVGDPPIDDDAIAMLIYTSGTTGKSKGVALPFRAIAANMTALTEAWGWSSTDRLSLMLPLFHVHGLCIGVHGALLRRVDTILHARFDPGALVSDLRDRGATIFMGVPTMYAMLLEHLAVHPDHARALGRARLFTSGSAPLAVAHSDDFHALTGHRILERYGMSETLITLSNPLEGERRPGSVGHPVPGCEIRIVADDGMPADRGELQVRGDSLMTGYWSDPEATAREYDGPWFKTGDVVERDPDGYLRILGRTSVDIIKSGGFKIAAREIEEVLLEHPWVAEAAVFGVPDPTWGQRIAAAVVVVAGIEPGADLLGVLGPHVAERLADYKRPRMVMALPSLPRNALGKLQKHRLLDLI
ncbi:MAG TPA: AMP-binding protein [Kofleriaceae bacterium]|nr:AMP-binding protein [Kofleriaceae bacterium]